MRNPPLKLIFDFVLYGRVGTSHGIFVACLGSVILFRPYPMNVGAADLHAIVILVFAISALATGIGAELVWWSTRPNKKPSEMHL